MLLSSQVGGLLSEDPMFNDIDPSILAQPDITVQKLMDMYKTVVKNWNNATRTVSGKMTSDICEWTSWEGGKGAGEDREKFGNKTTTKR